MKLLIVYLVILAVVAHAHAFLPGLPLLSLKKGDDSSDDDSTEDFVIKVPKLGLFGEKLLSLKEKKKSKDTLFEKITDKKNRNFEASLRDFFDDEGNAKTIYDKLQSFNTPKPAEEKPCKCPEPSNDDCDRDSIRYFS